MSKPRWYRFEVSILVPSNIDEDAAERIMQTALTQWGFEKAAVVIHDVEEEKD